MEKRVPPKGAVTIQVRLSECQSGAAHRSSRRASPERVYHGPGQRILGGAMRLTSVIASMLVATAVGAADRQPTYPLRPIRVIVPQGPGSTTDLLGRIVFTRMSDRLGKQLVVDNRPGAGGTLGMDLASHAAPDGYTIAGVAASMLTIGPHIYRKLPYDPLRDFVPIGLFVTAQTALCVNANLPARSVREFVDLAKS